MWTAVCENHTLKILFVQSTFHQVALSVFFLHWSFTNFKLFIQHHFLLHRHFSSILSKFLPDSKQIYVDKANKATPSSFSSAFEEVSILYFSYSSLLVFFLNLLYIINMFTPFLTISSGVWFSFFHFCWLFAIISLLWCLNFYLYTVYFEKHYLKPRLRILSCY